VLPKVAVALLLMQVRPLLLSSRARECKGDKSFAKSSVDRLGYPDPNGQFRPVKSGSLQRCLIPTDYQNDLAERMRSG
jgi:hypothetical protein